MSSAFTFSNDPSLIDRDLVHHWLSVESYWAQGRSRETQDAAMDESRNYSVRDADGRQVAYARVVTDGVTFAWLCDVFVDESARGKGIGRMIVEGVIQDLQDGSTVKRIVLATSTADGLYAKYGFAESPGPNRYMIKQMPRD
ncbi:putative GNAT family N-acyltransferase [Microbacterium phyllosphaerae]|uniref:GNAT family N-acyltransferase n=1 Tax=Microbacterium phyllosphaerae TaxID=124798 RepID=A0ABS4WRA4_9MICO|nr:GNAT family N-acetyltransferase [Microbacterium phyllosphaerae]MBP2378754.1 putative GNAT family N-acyltransferase [Microbacterium phyllosphaerae]